MLLSDVVMHPVFGLPIEFAEPGKTIRNEMRMTLRAESIRLLITPQFAGPGKSLDQPEFRANQQYPQRRPYVSVYAAVGFLIPLRGRIANEPSDVPTRYGHNRLVQRATISQVKNRLSAYLKKVRAGESVLILDRDQPIARIEPIRNEDDPDGHIAALASKGLLKPASKPLPLRLLKSIKPIRGSSVLQTLLEERREGH